MTDMAKIASSQTLARAMDLLDVLREGPRDLKGLQTRLGLSRSTVHRLASLLVDRQLLAVTDRRYRLGPGLIHLGFKAQEQRDLITIARPFLADLTTETEEATNLAVRDGDEIVYVAQVPGRRRVAVRHSVGDRNLVAGTALGRALLTDVDAAARTRLFRDTVWAFVEGCVLHREEGGDRICCIAAPIRDASGTIVAALSLSSTPQYMDADRMRVLSPRVRAAAAGVSMELGFGDLTDQWATGQAGAL
jgi:DNA-binding IclR family transcriptional regulator